MKAVMAKINDSHIPLCHKELEIQTYASKLQLELVYHKMASQYSMLPSQTKSSPNSFYYTPVHELTSIMDALQNLEKYYWDKRFKYIQIMRI